MGRIINDVDIDRNPDKIFKEGEFVEYDSNPMGFWVVSKIVFKYKNKYYMFMVKDVDVRQIE